MTRKEILEGLYKIKNWKCNGDAETHEIVTEAIKALKQAESCEDAISREELKKWLDMNFSFGGASRKIELFDRLDKELPPVTPTQNWIPVSERLPEPYTFVNATCRSLVDDRENWVVETIYSPIPKEVNEQGYSDWGNIPILNWGKAEVIAWMQRDIPKPYKVETKECKNCKHHTNGEEIHGVTPCGSCGDDKKNFEQK